MSRRLKRLSAIEEKLRRIPRMKLSRMQDIGGCRAVVGTAQDLATLKARLLNEMPAPQFVRCKDYVENPPKSGYRGVHLVWALPAPGLLNMGPAHIEVQVRTHLQHVWATAVESIALVTNEPFKSNLGNPEWLRFFALMGKALALRERPDETQREARLAGAEKSELRDLEARLDARAFVRACGGVLSGMEPAAPNGSHFLIELDADRRTLRVIGVVSPSEVEAPNRYFRAERFRRTKSSEVVLVSVDSYETLRAAYPNYFLDTREFGAEVDRALE